MINERVELPFSFWTAPRYGEPRWGYFNRLVSEEFHRSARTYLNAVWEGPAASFFERASRTVQLLPLADEDKASLDFWTPAVPNVKVKIAGQQLRSFQIRVTSRRFCAGCIAESAHHRVWWDLFCFRRCPLHGGAPLVERFSDRQHIRWSWPWLDVGPDGHPCGIEMESQLDTSSLEHYLFERWGVVPKLNRHPVLDKLPLDTAIEQCKQVGRLLRHPWQERRPAQATTGRQDSMP